MYGINGKVAIVTGGARGVGKAVAETLGKHGCKVAILDIEDATGEQTVIELSSFCEATYIHCDVSNIHEIEQSFDRVLAFFGQVDIMVNNAGIPVRDYIADITGDKWDNFNSINTKSVFFFSKVFSEHIKARQVGFGRIINLSSVRARVLDTYHPGYSITKSAVETITRSFAVSYGKYGITSNAIALGFVLTPMTVHYLDKPEVMETILKMSPIERAVACNEVADAIAFLASQLAGAINGQVLTIDGGGTCVNDILR